MSAKPQGCGTLQSSCIFFFNQAGFTCFRLMIGLAVLSILFAFGIKTVRPYRMQTNLFQTKHDIRKVQEAIILYHAEYDRIPSVLDLKRTYLKGVDTVDFVLVDASQYGSLAFDHDDDTLDEKLYSAINLIEQDQVAPQPSKWIIVSKRQFQPLAEMVFAVDDAVPVVVPGENQPVSHTQELAGL